jgi:Mrp family chromosome partitioning ATPase
VKSAAETTAPAEAFANLGDFQQYSTLAGLEETPRAGDAPHAPLENTPSVDTSAQTDEPILWSPSDWGPAFVVDRFSWPEVCFQLQRKALRPLGQLIAELDLTSPTAAKRVLFTGLARGAGRTSLVLTLARHLAQGDKRVAIVDGDFSQPNLALSLGVMAQSGWEDVLLGDLALDEAVVESVEDRISLLPLCGPIDSVEDDFQQRIESSLTELSTHFDVVLIDAAPLNEDGNAGGLICRDTCTLWDKVVLVHDHRQQSGELSQSVEARLEAAGIEPLGIVENFVDAA